MKIMKAIHKSAFLLGALALAACNEEVDAALGEALAAVRPEVDDAVLAPALADLDWDAVLERLLDSPFADL